MPAECGDAFATRRMSAQRHSAGTAMLGIALHHETFLPRD
jgi:hypothetical protein